MSRTIKWEYNKELNKYISEIKHYKTLYREEEREVGDRKSKGEREAMNKLVKHN